MVVKVVSVVVLLALALSGPLASAAWAQEKSEGQMAPAKGEGAWEAGAVVANLISVPGRAILCGGAVVTGVVALIVTFGSGHKAAGGVWHEGCSGRWTVTASDLKPEHEESMLWMETREEYKR